MDEELFDQATTAGDDTEDDIAWLVIDHDFRKITIPATKQLLGVTSDEDVNIIHFKCPKVCTEVDLSDFYFRVNYMNAGQEGDVYLVADKKVEGDWITFSWLVHRNACEYAGGVQFIICAKLYDDNDEIVKEYNTAVHTLTVAQGLETTEDLRPDYDANSDVIEQFLRNAQNFYMMSDDIENLKSRVDSIELENMRKFDGAFLDEDKYLYFSSNGQTVLGPLGPFAGGGGGGGGGGDSGNTAVLRVTNNTGWLSKTIASDSSCPISLVWSSIEDEMPTGDGTLRITVNNVLKAILQVQQGEVVVDLAQYCSNGANSCALRLADVYENSRTINFTIMVTAISLSSSFDNSVPFTDKIPFPYTPVGSIVKTVYFIVDGGTPDTTRTSASNRELTYTIPKQSHGAHTIQCYFEATINGEIVRSNELYYEFISLDSDSEEVIIISSFGLSEVNQYSTVQIPYRVYDPLNDSTEVRIYVNDRLVSTQTVDRTGQTFTYRATQAGYEEFTGEIFEDGVTYYERIQNEDESFTYKPTTDISYDSSKTYFVLEKTTIRIEAGSETKDIVFTVVPVKIDVEAETENLALYLNSQGRSNNEVTRAVWNYTNPSTGTTIESQLTNFNWILDGWQTDDDGINVLRLVDDARVTIPYKMFETDFKSRGKTIEIEFATRQVVDYNAEILTCWADNMGLKITPQSVTFKGAQTSIDTLFKENEHIRLSIVIDKQSANSGFSRLISVYIDGVMSRAIQYASGERFSQLNPVNISIGSNTCGIDIYNIRVYDNDLNRVQILDNWIADTQIGELMLERYQHNQVYNDAGDVTIATLPPDLPYWIIEATELPQYKGDKKTVGGSYTVPGNRARSFTFTGVEIDVQGTSSSVYFRKNYDLKFKKGFTTDKGIVDNYAIRVGSIPFNRFVLKADVASSESANNTELTMFYHDICPYRTPEMVANSKVRYGIEGIPVVLFWYNPDTQETMFMGKYNFNLPKRAAKPYGYGDDDTLESWDWDRNNSGNVKFQDTDWTSISYDEDNQPYPTWYDDFEARFPSDTFRDVSQLNEFLSWVKSTWREQATNELLPEPITYRLTNMITLNDYASDTSYTVVEAKDGNATVYDVTFTKDAPAYRLSKFRAEAHEYMELESAEFYYLFTEMFLMIDSRAKNMFVGFNGGAVQ